MDEDKKVLLVSDLEGVYWQFPKGHAEKNETLEQVALRETKEETGYEVEIIKRLSDITYIHKEINEPVRLAMFLSKPIKKGNPIEKNIQAKWFPVGEARKILYHNLVFLLDELN